MDKAITLHDYRNGTNSSTCQSLFHNKLSATEAVILCYMDYQQLQWRHLKHRHMTRYLRERSGHICSTQHDDTVGSSNPNSSHQIDSRHIY